MAKQATVEDVKKMLDGKLGGKTVDDFIENIPVIDLIIKKIDPRPDVRSKLNEVMEQAAKIINSDSSKNSENIITALENDPKIKSNLAELNKNKEAVGLKENVTVQIIKEDLDKFLKEQDKTKSAAKTDDKAAAPENARSATKPAEPEKPAGKLVSNEGKTAPVAAKTDTKTVEPKTAVLPATTPPSPTAVKPVGAGAAAPAVDPSKTSEDNADKEKKDKEKKKSEEKPKNFIEMIIKAVMDFVTGILGGGNKPAETPTPPTVVASNTPLASTMDVEIKPATPAKSQAQTKEQSKTGQAKSDEVLPPPTTPAQPKTAGEKTR